MQRFKGATQQLGYLVKEKFYRIKIFWEQEKRLKYAPVILLALFVLIFNITSYILKSPAYAKYAAAKNEYVYLTPEDVAGIVSTIDPYTPLLEENKDEIQIAMESEKDAGFLGKEQLTQGQEPFFAYTVEKGETISTVAKKFDLHVATIAQANNIPFSQVSNIIPGQILIIPAEDTSTSMAWLEIENQRKAAEEAKKQQEQAKKLALQKRSLVYREATSGYKAPTGQFAFPVGNFLGKSQGYSGRHRAVDLRAPVGSPVFASDSGKIIEITRGWSSGYGLSIVISHGNGYTTRYAHLSSINVSPGDFVSQGEVIGRVGMTGWTTGPHLHFEIHLNGSGVIPPF